MQQHQVTSKHSQLSLASVLRCDTVAINSLTVWNRGVDGRQVEPKQSESGVKSHRQSLHHISKQGNKTLRYLPEYKWVLVALAGVMLHIVEEAEEVLQSLKTDLVTNRLTSIQMRDCGLKSHPSWCDESINQLAEIKAVKFNIINKSDEFDLCSVTKHVEFHIFQTVCCVDVVAIEFFGLQFKCDVIFFSKCKSILYRLEVSYREHV